MECKLCKIKEGRIKAKILYEDAAVIAMLSENPATLGHIELFPKEHVESIDTVKDEVVQQLFSIANTAASALFEAAAAEGTNIVVYNGDHANNPYNHLLFTVLSRKQNDGISFQWKPQQLPAEEMDAVQSRIRDKAFMAEHQEKEKNKPRKEPEQHKDSEDVITIEDENYLVKQLNRMP